MPTTARDELLAVCRRVLIDPARGEADVTRIAASGASDDLLRRVARVLPDLPDPDLALIHLERYCREAPPPGDPDTLTALMTLLGFSPYLAEAILNDSGYLPELLRAQRQDAWGVAEYRDAVARWRRIMRSEDPWDALRSYKRRVNLRIALRDLQRRATFPEIAREISHAADALVESALEMATVDLLASHGRPQAHDPAGRIVDAGMTVLALGKLGGQELNYSSDIDLLFLYSRDGETSGAPGHPETQIGNKEFFTGVAERLARGLGHIGAEGQVFRVDCRLRPGGRDGDLVVPLEAAVAYYRTWARPWERQALIKARHCAGDAALAARFLSEVEPIIYPEEADPVVADSVRSMKDRIDAELARRGIAPFHLKLGRGGIREIEFTAQALQLVHGGKEPWLREPNTLLALHRLTDKGLLSLSEYGALTAAYVFLREAEHRLQLHRNLQRSVMPSTARDRRVLARSLGFRDAVHQQEAAAFGARLEEHREAVRGTYDAVLARLSQATLEESASADPFLDGMSDRDVADHLAAQGVRDAGSLLGSVQSLARLLASPAASPSARRAFRHVTPVILRELAEVHAPVRALRTLERFLTSLALDKVELQRLFDRREIFGPLMRLFAGSPVLSSILVHRPALVLEEGFGSEVARGRDVDEHISHLLPSLETLPDSRDIAAPLRVYQRTQILYIGLKDLNQQAGPNLVQRALTALAEAILRVCVAASARLTGWPVGEGTHTPGLIVLGLGKMGYREMDYASDLDLIFLYEAGAGPPAARHASANLLAQRAVEMLTSMTREGALYPVDMRLRPFGGEGELAQPVEQVLPYMETTAGVWEHQSFLKARAVAGDLTAGEETVLALEQAAFQCAAREDPGPAIREMRERLRQAAGTVEGRPDIKMGEGGLASIQFAVQCLQLRHRIPSPPFKRTTRLLSALKGAGVLDERGYRSLFTGFQFLRRLEHQLRLAQGRALSLLPESTDLLEELSVAMGYVPEEEQPARVRMLADLERHRRRVESVSRRVLEGAVRPDTVAGR
jgi:[glutamine synthetase] adenylyltransferase / [glutamine synthetase]-adenylyl-L-tyrosine phosphorylase